MVAELTRRGSDEPRRRALIVDDEPDILEVLTDILGGLGYDISTAIDGAEALAIVRATPPDVVLLDVTMPVMSGRETLAHLHREHPDLPVLIMAARLESAIYQELRALGALGYIAKPFDVAEIERAAAAAIARRRKE